MASKKHKITSEFLQELNSELEKRKVVTIDTFKGKAEVEVDVYLDEVKINKIIDDLTILISPLLATEAITEEDLTSPVAMLPVLILREFTNLPIPNENDLALISAVNETLIRTGIARQIFEKLNQYELQKLYDLVSIGFKNKPKFLRVYQEMAGKYSLQQLKHEGVVLNSDTQESQ